MNVWDQIREYLQNKVSAESYNNWLRGTSFLGMEGDTVFVSAPDRETRAWLELEYTPLVRAAIQELRLGVRHVSYECAAPPVKSPTPALSAPEGEWESTNHPLNPKFTFDSFVVGASNQFAHAAAKSVAKNPSRSYNPLFIYGGVGMGKTHLMHAIGRSLMDHYATMRVVYTSTERFMNEMISCIRTERMRNFHQRYREADVLLIDDIQMLGSKERTQEEFFHTFNDLHEHQKQIVISSDAPPRDIPGLVERLRSRFEWGLIADIQPPDLETKVAILQKKAETEQVVLPTDVALFIASNVRTNVRELEGALVRLIAWCQLNRMEITLAATQQCLKQFIDMQVRKITIEAIQRAVAEQFGMKVSDLKQKNNSRNVVVPRQIAMYLAKQMTEASLPEIGRQFGGKHHTTVMHSIAKIDEQRRNDKDLNRTVNKLMEQLG